MIQLGKLTRRTALLVVCSTLMAGCTSNQRKECESQNWEGIGYRDGQEGVTMDRVGRLADRCSDYDIEVDAMAYSQGHKEGLATFCDSGNAFDMGERRDEYSGACTNEFKKPFLESYLRGLTLGRDSLQLDYDQLTRQMDEKRRDRDRLDLDDSTKGVDEDIDELESKLRGNLDERRDVNNLITRWSRALNRP